MLNASDGSCSRLSYRRGSSLRENHCVHGTYSVLLLLKEMMSRGNTTRASYPAKNSLDTEVYIVQLNFVIRTSIKIFGNF